MTGPVATNDGRMRDLFTSLEPLTDEVLDVAAHPENSELHFIQAITQVRVILRLARAMSQEFEDEIPSNVSQQARESVNSVLSAIDQMTDFDLQQSSAPQLHGSINNSINSIDKPYTSASTAEDQKVLEKSIVKAPDAAARYFHHRPEGAGHQSSNSFNTMK